MPHFEFCEELACWPYLALSHVLEALTYTLRGIGPSSDIQQPLVGFCILYNGRGFALDGQYDRTFALFELLHELAGAPAERGQRLDVLRDIEHMSVSIKAPF